MASRLVSELPQLFSSLLIWPALADAQFMLQKKRDTLSVHSSRESVAAWNDTIHILECSYRETPVKESCFIRLHAARYSNWSLKAPQIFHLEYGSLPLHSVWPFSSHLAIWSSLVLLVFSCYFHHHHHHFSPLTSHTNQVSAWLLNLLFPLINVSGGSWHHSTRRSKNQF